MKRNKTARIFSYILGQELIKPRMYLAALWPILFLYAYYAGLRAFCLEYGVSVSCWSLPLLLGSYNTQCVFALGAAFLFCDIPFYDRNTMYIVIRSGRQPWIQGQIIYILTASVLYSLMLFIFGNLLLFPQLSLEMKWGAVLKTLAQTKIATDYGLPVLSYTIMKRFSPLAANALSLLILALNAAIMGVVQLYLNARFFQGIGLFACVLISLTPLLPHKLAEHFIRAYHFAPPAWANIDLISWDGKGAFPTWQYVFAVLIILFILFVMAAYKRLRYCDLDSIPER